MPRHRLTQGKNQVKFDPEPETVINIGEFPIDKIKLSSKIAVIGKPGTGKSCLLKDIAYNLKHKVPVAEIWSGTEDSNDSWKEVIPSLYIHSSFDEQTAERAIVRQKLAKKICDNPYGLYIWDDCTDDASYFMKKVIKAIHKNGRHWKAVFCFSLQYALDMKPIIRGNIDYAFMLLEKSKDARQKLYKNYASAIPDFETFNALMDDLTDDYGCIVIDNTSHSNKFEETVFYYKARIRGKWTFGCQEYVDHAEERYDQSYIEPLY